MALGMGFVAECKSADLHSVALSLADVGGGRYEANVFIRNRFESEINFAVDFRRLEAIGCDGIKIRHDADANLGKTLLSHGRLAPNGVAVRKAVIRFEGGGGENCRLAMPVEFFRSAPRLNAISGKVINYPGEKIIVSGHSPSRTDSVADIFFGISRPFGDAGLSYVISGQKGGPGLGGVFFDVLLINSSQEDAYVKLRWDESVCASRRENFGVAASPDFPVEDAIVRKNSWAVLSGRAKSAFDHSVGVCSSKFKLESKRSVDSAADVKPIVTQEAGVETSLSPYIIFGRIRK